MAARYSHCTGVAGSCEKHRIQNTDRSGIEMLRCSVCTGRQEKRQEGPRDKEHGPQGDAETPEGPGEERRQMREGAGVVSGITTS